MKTSASKGRNICHTPVSVHGICFMLFEADLFMASTQYLNFIWQRWQCVIHSQESMRTSASKGRNICHTPASVHGICFMPFETDLFMASINLSISQFYLAEVAMTDSLSRTHEELSLKGQKQMSHTSECTWHLFHAV